jgi:transposase
MKQIKVDNEETIILKKYFKTSPVPLIRHKAQAIIMRSEGLELAKISMFLFKSERAISRWIEDFNERRMASIFCGYLNNENAKKLTREQKKEVKEALQCPPSEFGLPKDFWDVPQLKSYVEAMFGVVFESAQSYHFLLRFSDLSFKYPDTFSIRRNDDLIEKRMAEIKQEIEPYLQDPSWEVFAADETRMVLEALTRKAWLKKGERTIIKVQQSAEYQSYFGALNQKNFKCYVYELDWQNQEEILDALKKLLESFPDKKICIVWDNARFHKGKLIQEALKKGNLLERVHLINFPPYAPDHNPIEHVWNTVKANLSNQQFDSFEVTKAMFRREVDSRIFNYQI